MPPIGDQAREDHPDAQDRREPDGGVEPVGDRPSQNQEVAVSHVQDAEHAEDQPEAEGAERVDAALENATEQELEAGVDQMAALNGGS